MGCRCPPQYDDAALLQVTHRAAANERLGDGWHLDSGLHPCHHAQFLHSILHRQGIHDGCQHTHVVGGGAVNARRGCISAAPDIAATNDNGDLDAQIMDSLDLTGDAAHRFSVDAVAFA